MLNSFIKNKILEFLYYPYSCSLGDCNHLNCHTCYPVKNCKFGHSNCLQEGICVEYMDVFKYNILQSNILQSNILQNNSP